MDKATDNRERAMVLLRHECGEESHYDLMLEQPDAPPGKGDLLTWRIAVPTWQWRAGDEFICHHLALHRRAYLQFEGEISGGRGNVHRVDEGGVRYLAWNAGGGRVCVKAGKFCGVLIIEKMIDSRWVARLE